MAAEGLSVMKYRKKPVVIEAFKWNGEELGEEAPKWLREAFADGAAWYTTPGFPAEVMEIETLEGIMRARPGDWIIKGVQGEFYPCKPDIFEATYEAVEP